MTPGRAWSLLTDAWGVSREPALRSGGVSTMGCASSDQEGCGPAASPMDNGGSVSAAAEADWLEQPLVAGFRIWHIMFLCFASLLALVVLLCCCFRFRIPRTKQEIEADYVRKKITRKFQKQLKAIANTEMDEMDLKKALDRVRAELKSDSDSSPLSEASGSSADQDPAQDNKQGTCNDEPDTPRAEEMKVDGIAETCFMKSVIKRQDSVLS